MKKYHIKEILLENFDDGRDYILEIVFHSIEQANSQIIELENILNTICENLFEKPEIVSDSVNPPNRDK